MHAARLIILVAVILIGIAPRPLFAQQDPASAPRGDLNNDFRVDKTDYKVLRDLVAHYRRYGSKPGYELPQAADLTGNQKLGRKDLRAEKRIIRDYAPTPGAAAASDIQLFSPIETVAAASESSLQAVQDAVTATAPTIRMGTNLNGLTYYSPEWVFTDCFKQAMPWISQSDGKWNDGRTIQVRPDGGIILEPGQAAATLIFRDVGGHYPTGQYVCTYEGVGAITFHLDARTVSQAPNRIVAEVTTPGTGGICLKVAASDPANPVRNIKLWLPGFENSTGTFHPLFLERLRGFKVLRFMDWQRTNASTLSSWADRTLPTDYSQATVHGVAVEYMVQLANELDADAWFCMPHLADDDFVRSFATLVRDTLEPGRKAYIEYSNEVWNSIFPHIFYACDQGEALGLSTNRYQAGRRFYANRSVQIFQIWEEAFGGTDRLVRVIAGQAANPFLGDELLKWNGTAAHTDALAIAPYFNATGIESRLPGATVDDVFELAEADIRGAVLDRIKLSKQFADENGVSLIAYEGGQHFVSANNTELTDLFIAANRDPRMYDLYTAYFNAWNSQNPGGTFVNFTTVFKPSKFGSWGTLEYQDQPVDQAPKYRAVKDAMAGDLPSLDLGVPTLSSLGIYD